jgi:hypothetical protein
VAVPEEMIQSYVPEIRDVRSRMWILAADGVFMNSYRENRDVVVFLRN